MLKCRNCGAQLDSDALFCTECGTKVDTQGKVCPCCGAGLDDDSLFCSECGTKLDVVANTPNDQPQDKIVIEQSPENLLVDEQHPTPEQSDNRGSSSINSIAASPKNNNSLKYVIAAIASVALIVVGWLVYNHYMGSMLDRLEFVTPIKYVRVTSQEAALYTENNENAPLAMTEDGTSVLSLSEGNVVAAIENYGDWYKIVYPSLTYREVFIKASDCGEVIWEPVQDTLANYLTIEKTDFGSSYIVHRLGEKQIVMSHRISPEGDEYLGLGTCHNGMYIFNYSVKVDNSYWSEYRKEVSTDTESVSLIDFNQIPKEHLTDPFKEKIKNNERAFTFIGEAYMENWRFRKIDISKISTFYKSDHPHLEGRIAKKYDFVMFLDVYDKRVEGRYRVLQSSDGFVTLSGSITDMGKVEVYEYNKEGSQTGYYFSGTLNDRGFSGKYLSTEKNLKMSFTSKVK